MSRNLLFAVVGALVVAVAVLGYMAYQDRKQPDGLEIKLGKQGVEIKGN